MPSAEAVTRISGGLPAVLVWGRAVQPGERFTMRQELCGVVSEVDSPAEGIEGRAGGVEPPELVPPAASDVLLVLAREAPGAIIHAWHDGSYLLSGVGTLIDLRLSLQAGDLIRRWTMPLSMGTRASMRNRVSGSAWRTR